jgi:autotransporter strand-loop-strand O-heptosyltransferase
MAFGLPVIGTIEEGNELQGMIKADRTIESALKALNRILFNYECTSRNAIRQANSLSWDKRVKSLLQYYANNKPKNMKHFNTINLPHKSINTMATTLIREYNNTEIKYLPKIEISSPSNVNNINNIPTININFIDGALCEILSNKPNNYKVSFIDLDTNIVIDQATIQNNMWRKTSRKYFTNWKIEVYDLDSNNRIFEHIYNATNKTVYIALESKSIGDTIAWFPYVEEFRKKHNCKLIVSTFHNSWFKTKYPEITFIPPGQVVNNLYAMYRIGWYYNDDQINNDLNPFDFRAQPLQKTASDILGLEYIELKPKHTFKKNKPTIQGDYVCISPHASAHAKYWNYPGGWQTIINYLNSIGYKVVLISQEKLGDQWHDSKIGNKLYGVIDKTGDLPLEDRANDILNSKLFIGVGSGLAWISWMLEVPTILISGFSAPYTEFNNGLRIFTPALNKFTCNSCFNKFKLDAGDWDWCPINKNTPKMFECTTTIEPATVITNIDISLSS